MSDDPPPLRILVVEDEALLAMDIEMTVEDCGHVVAGEARCLHSALALADSTDPNLALVDIQLARGTSGIDVAAMIQRRWPDALIVFVTANPTRIPADYDGAHGVIAKPFSRKGLVATLSFLAEEIRDPPPHVRQPDCLMGLPRTARRWSH